MPKVVVQCGVCSSKITLKGKSRYFRHCKVMQEITAKNTLFVGATRPKKGEKKAKEPEKAEELPQEPEFKLELG